VWVVGNVIVRWRRRWWTWLIRDLIVQLSPTSLLVEDFEVILHFCEPRSFYVDVLSTSFDTLYCGLPSKDGFLFLSEPLDLLLDSG
jgi:hypothetical protein